MNLSDLDRDTGYSPNAGPIALCLQRLRTLLASPSVDWHPNQRRAAERDLDAAERLLRCDLLGLTHKAIVLRRIDRVEAEGDVNPPAPSDTLCRCGIPRSMCHPDCPHRATFGRATCAV